MNKGEAMKLLATLRAAWPRQEVGQDTAAVYAAMLADLPLEEAKAAVQLLVQTSRFFPTIAEIREKVAEARCGDLTAPELAWGEVQEAIGRVGSYHRPLFANPAIQRAVDAIGWRAICLDENLSATRARFLDAYKAARAQAIEAVATGRALPSPYASAQMPERGNGLEHGSFVFVGKAFELPKQLEEPEPAKQLVDGLARRLRVVRGDDEEI